MATMQKITSNLWFDTLAEEAENFILLFSKTPGLGKYPIMEKKVMRFTKCRREVL